MISCSNTSELKTSVNCVKNKYDNVKKIDMVESSTISIKLDENSSDNFFSSHYDYSTNRFSFINRNNRKLYIYKNFKFQKSINLNIDGPNGVGSLLLMKHKIFDHDSIFLFNTNSSELSILNKEGDKIYSALLNNGRYFPFINELSHLQKINNKIYLPVVKDKAEITYSNFKSALEFDLISKEKKYLINYPKNYDNVLWGSGFKYENSLVVRKNKIYSSFPVSHKIIAKNLKSQKAYFNCAKSKYVNNLEPYKKIDSKLELKQRDFYKEDIYSLSQNDYPALFYHNKFDLFIRIAYLRPSKKDVSDNIDKPDFSISLFDKNFNKSFEKKFNSNKYYHTKIYLHTKGLMIGRRDLYRENENKLVFSIFKFEAIK